MSTNIKITFNSEGFRQILMSDGVKAVVQEAADDIAAKANGNMTTANSEGFEASVWQGAMMSKYGYGGRWMGSVSSRDSAAAADEAETKCLSRAVTG